MKGKQGGQSEGGGMIVGAEVCAMHSENGRWPPAKECGQSQGLENKNSLKPPERNASRLTPGLWHRKATPDFCATKMQYICSIVSH